MSTISTTPSQTSSSQPEGFLLLTIPNCTVSTPSTPPQTGLLALQCVTLNVPDALPNRDVWLVLKLNGFEMVISPTQTINYSRSMNTYMFLPEHPEGEPVRLVVPLDPMNSASAEDLETMEVLISQYGVLHDLDGTAEKGEKIQPPPSFEIATENKPLEKSGGGAEDYKGRLVLMDEDSGEVVGALDEKVPIKEDNAISARGHEKDPVVVDLPTEEEELAGRIEAYVHPPTPEQQDMLMKTAGLISRGILLASSVLATGMTAVSNYYISHSTPTSKPVEFSPRTKANVKRIHKISGTAVFVTAKTTGAIFKTIDYVAQKVAGSSPTSRVASPSTQQPSTLVPLPLPARSESPAKGKGAAPPLPPRGSLSPGPPSLPARKPRLLNRVLASTDLILTAVDHSTKKLLETGSDAISGAISHKYGQEAGNISRMTGKSVTNVGLVYIDVKGVGRRALLTRAGKVVVKAKMGGKDVILGPQAQQMQAVGGSSPSRSASGSGGANGNASPVPYATYMGKK